MHGLKGVLTTGSISEDIGPNFAIKARASVSDGVIEYVCEVIYKPTRHVVYREENKDWYWVRHIVREVIKRLSTPPKRRRKGVVTQILENVEREEFFLDTGFYPGCRVRRKK